MPGIFVLGLLLIPLGMWRGAPARAARAHARDPAGPCIDLNDPAHRCAIALIVAAAHHRQRAHRRARGVPRRRVHGLGAVLRPGLPRGDAAGVRVVPGRARTRASAAWSATSAPARRGSCSPSSSGARQLYAVTLQHALAPDPLAGAEPAAGARHLRAVPLAGEVPRRQDPRVPRVRRRRGEHRIGDRAAGPRRRRQREPRPREGIHWHTSRRQRDRIRRHRRQAPGDPVVRLTMPDGQRKEWTADGVTAGRAREGRAAADGLHGLPQPPEPSVRRVGGARRRPGDRAGRDRQPAVHPPRGGAGAQGEPIRPGRGLCRIASEPARRSIATSTTPTPRDRSTRRGSRRRRSAAALRRATCSRR